ncbi:hypothetical protein [Nocardiopsis ansamitocini]|nr:hypothetical protein [Nocardiopsis ansamitocini]
MALEVADTVTVMDAGRVVHSGDTALSSPQGGAPTARGVKHGG